MKRRESILLCFSCLSLLFASGCAHSRLEKDYGTSFELQKSNQILNLEAGKNLDPVKGLNGTAAQKSEEKYQKGFEKTESSSKAYQINIGSTGK